MTGSLVWALFAFAAGARAERDQGSLPQDSTAFVRESAGSAKASRPKAPPPSPRASVDPDVAVPQAGAGVLIRKPTPVTPNPDTGLPRLRLSTLDNAVPVIAAGGGSAAEAKSLTAPKDGRLPSDRASQDRAINEANRRLASAEEKMRRRFSDTESALRDVEEALALVPKHPKAFTLLAALHNRKGEYAKAEDSATAALHLYSRNPAARGNLALAQLLQGRAEQAEKNSAVAVTEEPTDAFARYVHALCLDASGRREEAREELIAAAALDPARFGEKAKAAAKGAKIFKPGGGDAAYALAGEGPPAASRAPWRLAVGVLLLLVLVISMLRLSSKTETTWKPAAPAQAPAQEGLLAGKYQLIRPLGSGEVHEGFECASGRPVAVKKISEDLAAAAGAGGRTALLRGARKASSLRHPAIVEIYDVLERGFDVYLVFELVKGKSLDRILQENKRLSLAQAFEILKPVCQALAFAHERGVFHGGLKPSDILVTQQGGVKMKDLGLGGESAASKEADVRSLGRCLYEIVSGRPASPSFVPLSTLFRGTPPGLDTLIRDALDPGEQGKIAQPLEFLSRLEALVVRR